MPLIDPPDMSPLDSSVIYPPVGYCIYCFTHRGDLTDEHALPNGLGGRHVIQKASCASCQKIINEEFEQYCMRTLMGLARQKYGIKSKNKRPSPRASITVLRKTTREEERVYKPIEEMPQILSLPAFPPPFMLHNLKPPERVRGGNWTPFYPSRDFLDSVDAEAVVTERVSVLAFARQLAKIAHCLSFARLGFDSFEPWLPDLILGRRKGFIELVGGSLTPQPPIEGKNIFFGIRPQLRVDGMPLLVCDIRLFAFLGSPLYTVVVGRIRSEPRRVFGQ